MAPVVVDPYAIRKGELSKLTKVQLQQLISDLQSANLEKQKINQKYANQVKEMTSDALSAVQSRNEAYLSSDLGDSRVPRA